MLAAKKKHRYEEVRDDLIKKIFTRSLKPEDKLPTETVLAKEFTIDKTSLRVALKQLEAMQVLDIRHGDGMYVKDFVDNAGMEFLGMLFQEDDSVDEILSDKYMLNELFELWVLIFPDILKITATRISPKDISDGVMIIEEMLKHIEDKKRLVELEIQLQDMVIDIAGNRILKMFFNSLHLFRKRIYTVFYDFLSEEELRKLLILVKSFIDEAMQATPEQIDKIIEAYRDVLKKYSQTLINKIIKNPGRGIHDENK
jgi:GntR family transcriptional repressor for pyruvate dehydrogenase complex